MHVMQVGDAELSVCSPVVPSLLQDNFDFASRCSLVKGVLQQEDLTGYTVQAQVLRGPLLPLRSPASFQALRLDFLSMMTPVIPVIPQ